VNVMGEPFEFDLGAATWRHAHADEGAFVEALADRLLKSLPDLVRVERDHRLFTKTHHIVLIEVCLEGDTYILQSDGRRFQTRKAKQVGGIAISTKAMQMAEWLSELSSSIIAYAHAHEDARRALEDFLL
jgi:hypothetical protein